LTTFLAPVSRDFWSSPVRPPPYIFSFPTRCSNFFWSPFLRYSFQCDSRISVGPFRSNFVILGVPLAMTTTAKTSDSVHAPTFLSCVPIPPRVHGFTYPRHCRSIVNCPVFSLPAGFFFAKLTSISPSFPYAFLPGDFFSSMHHYFVRLSSRAIRKKASEKLGSPPTKSSAPFAGKYYRPLIYVTYTSLNCLFPPASLPRNPSSNRREAVLRDLFFALVRIVALYLLGFFSQHKL